jgi:hypothetical protein
MYVAYPQRPGSPIRFAPGAGSSALWSRSSSRLIRQAPAPHLAWMAANSRRPRRPGLGQASSTQTIANYAAQGASLTVSTLVSLGAVTGPVGAAIGGLIGVATLLVSVFKGCGAICVEATQIANQVEQALQTNLSQYMSAPVHYASMQTAALNNFTVAWTALTQGCGQPGLQSAGQNCISERQQGACSYKTTPGGWQQGSNGWTYVYPGANGSGSACWNWWIGYHDPIASDPTVVPDPVPATAASAVTSTASSALQAVGINPASTIFGIPLSTLALPAAALLLLLLLGD